MLLRRLARKFCIADVHSRHLKNIGITTKRVLYNPSVPELYEVALLKEPPADPSTRQTFVASNGALCAYSGLKTGREPKNGRLVRDANTEKDVYWYSKNNIPLPPESFKLLEQFAISFINHHNRCIIIDGYAGWDKNNRYKIRVYCTRSYHALFMKNMLITPTKQELEEDFAKGVDIHIFNAGYLNVSMNIPGLTDKTICALNLSDKKMVILGTQFAGEMKKSIFKIMHYYMPKKNVLTLHASAFYTQSGYTIMCGLSATGKTALGLHKEHRIIGDDEICWTEDGLNGIEGGCYAKTIALTKENEEEIFKAIKFGAIVYNVLFKPGTREINYSDTSITENGRVSFPLSYLSSPKIPAVGNHPNNIIFLTCDTKGVLPPVALLDDEQAAFMFLSGYTAKIGGTTLDMKVPESTFSACFGEIFLPMDPVVYAKMFYEKLKKHRPKVWFVNTGWTNGRYGVGKRISIKDSQKILKAIHSGYLDKVKYKTLPYFYFKVPKEIPGVNSDLLNPAKGWDSKIEYEETLSSLAVEFIENYNNKYRGRMGEYSALIDGAIPKI